MGNYYPAGAANDPKAPYNERDHTHEHQWNEAGFDNPIIEDGAAIFHLQCTYAEGLHGEKWQCEKTRSYRFEYSTLTEEDGTVHELPTIGEWDDIDEEIEKKVIRIEAEMMCNGTNGDVSMDVDPDPDRGVVTIEYDGMELRFEP